MLKSLGKSGHYIGMAGFRNVRISDSNRFLRNINQLRPLSVEVQFLDAEVTATWQHLYFAALNALVVFKNKTNIAKSLAMETLVFAAAERQITKATELLGIKPLGHMIAALVIGKSLKKADSTLLMIGQNIGGQQDNSVLELSKGKISKIKRTFNVSTEELETITEAEDGEKALIDLVIERIALSATAR